MTDPVRQELLTVLAKLSRACPEMRFGQLIANLSTLAKRLSPEGLWDIEDDELLAAACEQLKHFVDLPNGNSAPSTRQADIKRLCGALDKARNTEPIGRLTRSELHDRRTIH